MAEGKVKTTDHDTILKRSFRLLLNKNSGMVFNCQ
jgi:hypothetical protein